MAIRVLPVNDPPQCPVTDVTILEDQSYTFQVVDFGFSDPNDSPSNSLLAVILGELPVTVGILKLNGSAVGMGQMILASSIAVGQLVFTPKANANGLATFTYRLQDTGGTASGGSDTMPYPSYMAIHVLSVNDAPSGQTYDHVTTKDDVPYTFEPSDFSFFDFIDSPANGLNGVIIASLPPVGMLVLAGTAVTVNQLIPASAIQAGQFAYVPRADVNVQNSTTTTFKLRIQDDGGAANGGNDTDTVASTMQINVQWINHPPTGANRTVSVFQNTSRPLTRSDFGYSDPLDQPQNAMRSVKINSIPTLGVLALSGFELVTAGQVVSASDLDAGKLLYAAPATATPIDDPLTFQVQDAGGTSTGGLDTDPTPKTMTLHVTNVANHSPSATNGNVITAENVAYTFQAADFGFSDPNDSPSNNLLAVQVGLPAVGTLKLYGSVLTVGKLIPAVDIVTGKLTYTAPPNRFGTNLASFQFTAQDDGGRASGAYDYAPTRTMTISVLHANHAPSGTTSFPRTNEDAPYVVKVSDFRFSDANDLPANAFQSIVVATPILRGTLTVSGSPAVPGQTIPVSEIAAGHVLLHPAPNSDDFVYFSFRVQDNGGTANGGIDTDPISYPPSLDLLITPVNDAPAGIDKIVTLNEDAAYIYQAADFGFGDSLDPTPNNLKAVKITTTPIAGTLTNDGTPVSAGTFVSAADIDAGRLIFIPTLNANGLPYTAFTFQVQDDGGTASGGFDTDPTPNTITINVLSANDAPKGTNRVVAVAVDCNNYFQYVFSASDFGFTDPYDSPSNSLAGITIVAFNGGGSLAANGLPVTANQFIPAADLVAGKLVYTAGLGSASDTIVFQVKDNGGTANGGIDFDPAAKIITMVPVPGPYRPPSAIISSVTAFEDVTYVFSPVDFPFDASYPGDLTAVRVTTLPYRGALTNNNLPVTVGQFISVIDISTGNFRYHPLPPNANGTSFTSFTFQVQADQGQNCNGLDLDPTPNTLTINVMPVNDPPTGTDRELAIPPAIPFSISSADFGFADILDPPANNFRTVKIAAIPSTGELTLQGIAVVPGQFINAFDIDFGSLRFTPPPSVSGVRFDAFTFQVQDDGGTANGGADIDPTPNFMTFRSICDVPVMGDRIIDAWEDVAYTLSLSDFGIANLNDLGTDAVSINQSLPAGMLEYNGVPLASGALVPTLDISAGQLVFVPPPNASGPSLATVDFVIPNGVPDGIGICLGTRGRIVFNVSPVNDPPSYLPIVVPPVSDESGLISIPTQISVGPPDEAGQKVTQFFVAGLLNAGLFSFPPQFDADGNLMFQPKPNVKGTAQITVGLKDDGGTAIGGIDTNASQMLTIEVFKAREWHNALKPLDVSGDGSIVNGDALDVINLLNAFGPQLVPNDGRAEGAVLRLQRRRLRHCGRCPGRDQLPQRFWTRGRRRAEPESHSKFKCRERKQDH